MKKEEEKYHTILGENKFVIIQNIKNTKKENCNLIIEPLQNCKNPKFRRRIKIVKQKQ